MKEHNNTGFLLTFGVINGLIRHVDFGHRMRDNELYQMGYTQAKSGFHRKPLFPDSPSYMEGWNLYVNEVLPELLKLSKL